MVAALELTGTNGCCGDGPCYCDSADAYVQFSCHNATHHRWVEKTLKDGRAQLVPIKNRARCKQSPIKISELSDAQSIGRWLTKYYNPTT